MKYPHPPKEVTEHFCKMFKEELDCLYYGDIYILTLDEEGEEFLEYLYDEKGVLRYGCYIYTRKFKGEFYNIVLVNND